MPIFAEYRYTGIQTAPSAGENRPSRFQLVIGGGGWLLYRRRYRCDSTWKLIDRRRFRGLSWTQPRGGPKMVVAVLIAEYATASLETMQYNNQCPNIYFSNL